MARDPSGDVADGDLESVLGPVMKKVSRKEMRASAFRILDDAERERRDLAEAEQHRRDMEWLDAMEARHIEADAKIAQIMRDLGLEP